MNDYLLNIIVPVYNRADLVLRCVNGILAQTLDVEIVLIDDCSTDNTAEVCIELSNKYDNIVFVQMKQNKGPGAARNEGIKVAKGDFMFFLDSDDCIDNLTSLLELLTNNPDADVIYSNMITVCTDGSTYNSRHGFLEEKQYDNDTWFEISKQFVIHTHMYRTVRSEFIRKNNILFPELYCAEDGMFTLNTLLNANHIVVTPLYLYKYYQGIPNSLVESSRNESNILRNYESMLCFMNYVTSLLTKESNLNKIEFLNRSLDTLAIQSISFASDEIFDDENIVNNYFLSLCSKLQDISNEKNIFLCPGTMWNVRLYQKLCFLGGISIDGFLDSMDLKCAKAKQLMNSGYSVHNPNYITGQNVVVVLYSVSPAISMALLEQFECIGFSSEYYKGVYLLTKGVIEND